MTVTCQTFMIFCRMQPFLRQDMIPLLSPCNILASHELLYGIFDLTYQNTRAGSMTMRRAVKLSNYKPSLVLVLGSTFISLNNILTTLTN
jgi:hypothetical protein